MRRNRPSSERSRQTNQATSARLWKAELTSSLVPPLPILDPHETPVFGHHEVDLIEPLVFVGTERHQLADAQIEALDRFDGLPDVLSVEIRSHFLENLHQYL